MTYRETALLLVLVGLPAILALWAKQSDVATQADFTLPIAIYYLIFLVPVAGLAALVAFLVFCAKQLRAQRALESEHDA